MNDLRQELPPEVEEDVRRSEEEIARGEYIEVTGGADAILAACRGRSQAAQKPEPNP